MATHSSVLAWRIPGMGEPGGLLVYGVAQSRTRVKWLSSSSKFIWNPDSQWEGIRKWLYPEDTALILGMSALRIREISFPSTTWGHRGPLPVNQEVASHQIPSTLELLFGTCQPPELWDRNVCCLSHPTYGIFFYIAARTNWDKSQCLNQDSLWLWENHASSLTLRLLTCKVKTVSASQGWCIWWKYV